LSIDLKRITAPCPPLKAATKLDEKLKNTNAISKSSKTKAAEKSQIQGVLSIATMM
jgi:hypothetical protein